MTATRPTIAALYCVYDDDLWLPYSVASIYNSVDQIYFFLSTEPWFGPKRDGETTKRCIQSLSDPLSKIQIFEQPWANEVSQRNFSLALAETAGHSYGFIVDADEIYDSKQLSQMFQYAVERDSVSCWHLVWHTYWKSIRYRIEPAENYHPPVLVKLGTGGFVEARNFASPQHELIPPTLGICHHMSYARTDDLIRKKITSFTHAPQILTGWFENVWLAWDKNPELINLHPVAPEQYQRTCQVDAASLPPVLYQLAAMHPNFPRD